MLKILIFTILEFFILKTTILNLINSTYGMLTFIIIPIIVGLNLVTILLFRSTLKADKASEGKENVQGKIISNMALIIMISFLIIYFNNSIADSSPHFHWNFG